MATKNSKNLSRIGFLVCALLTSLLVSLSAQAAVDRTSSIEASGEGSIYDLKATATGTLRVCTKPGRAGDRWRATIAQVITGGAVSAVGTGGTTFTGCVSRSVTSGTQYVVLVTWDRPLPGTLPATVTTRFTGPTDATNPPVVQLNGGALASIVPRPRSFVEGGYGCPADGSIILPGMLLTNCQFSPAGDTDSFKFSVSAAGVASVKMCGPLYSLLTVYSPTGNGICQTQSGYGMSCNLYGTGTYTIGTQNTSNVVGPYTLSLNGVSQEFQNGVPITFGQTKPGTLDACADEDTFQFVCQANQVVRITVTGPSNIVWTLFSPTGSYMTSSSGTNQAQCASGTHTILVSNNSGLTGAYNLTLQKVSGP
jgi:hypothetical protein